MKKILIAAARILIIVIGVLLLVRKIVLMIISAADLSFELINFTERFACIEYISFLIMSCVPGADLFILSSLSKSNKSMKKYLWAVFLIYTSFFVLDMIVR